MNTDFEKDFHTGYQVEKAKKKRPTVLVCGYTGSGKSSLIRAICGSSVPELIIGDGWPKTMGFDKFETDDIRIYDSKGLEIGETEEEFTNITREFIRTIQDKPNVDDHIHLVWYTIQGSGARITDCDINLINNIFRGKNVIVVLTKKDITRPGQLAALEQRLLDAGIPKERIIATSDEETGAEGCRELMQLSYRMLPEAYRDAFIEAQQIDLEAKIQAVRGKSLKAKAIIAAGVAAAAGIAAIPIPVADAPLLMGAQATMIGSLAALYGLDKSQVTHAALPLLAKTAGMFASSSLIKLIPGLGSVIQATVASGITFAIGAFVRGQFEENAIARIKGEPVPEPTFDPRVFIDFYEQYKKGAEVS